MNADVRNRWAQIPTDDPYRLQTAVHEAGHAVVATLTGFSVEYATIAARRAAGAVMLRPRRRWPHHETVAISCAGMVAEDVVDTGDRWEIVEASHSGDVTEIRDGARRWHATRPDDSTVLGLIGEAWATAYDLVTGHYGAVLDVTARLLTSRKTLTGREIKTLIAAAPTVTPPPPLTDDGRTFWVPPYTSLRSWGPATRRRRQPCPV